ncbi:MAG: FG-GAP-like repeat-containing protein, partial [Bacteroidia bacterium]|nr:FG-GAP-like repeat-containing protein [Bacteroidia bacterium]
MMRKLFFTIAFFALTAVFGMRSEAQTAVIDNTSTYTPTTITNGSFDEEPWMDYTYNGVHYTSCPHTWEENHAVSDIVFHGIGEGWNTTETETWRGNLFEYTCGEHSHVYQHNPSIPLTDKYIEMNCHHSTVFYQDLITYGHDVIRFTLKHAVTTSSSASNLQSMRVEIGTPELDGYGSIVNASGQGANVNSRILPLSKAIYRNTGVTDSYGSISALGFAGPDIANLLLDRNAQSNGWFETSGVYMVPEGQTVSRFAFISEADSPNFGNLMDDITFSTLIGNLMAAANDDCSVTITGYWGDTDTEKKLNIKIGDHIIPVDMSSVCGNNFIITIPNDIIGSATQVEVYHQDYEQAKQTVEIIKYKHKSYIFDTTCHGSDGYHGHGFDIAGPLMPGIYNDSLYIESQTVCSDSVVYLTLTVIENSPIPLPDNVDTADCVYFPGGTDWNIKIDWSSDPVVSNLNTPFVGDLDNDGHPEVICFSKNSDSSTDPRTNRQILVFDGVTRQLKSTITMPSFVTAYDAAAYGLVKLPSKKGLIIVANYDYKLRAYDITSSDPNTPYWVSDVDYGSNHGDWAVNVGFADFNHDGHPELYVRDKIYNAETGKLLAAATGGSNTASSYCHFSHLTHWKLSSPIAADLCGDANLDLILGNEIYKVNITNTSGTEGNSIVLYKQITPPNGILADGNPQVADFNNDGRLDVFISVRDTDSHNGTVYCYVWDVSNNTVSTPLQISTSFSGKSIPMISDIDNDGRLEVLIQCYISSSNDKFQAYKYNPDTRTFSYQWGLSTDEDSYSNSITSFDFNQDGLLELLICDQSRIRIVNGSGKSHKTHNDTIPMYVLNTFNFYEITIMQYPVIADVDNDGRAEIISVGSDKLNFFKSVDNSWAPTRKVWNQYMYNVTNVNNDLTIPQYQFNNATAFTDPDNIVRHPYNNYLQQATTIDQYGRPFYGIPDVAITNISGSQTDEGLTLSIDYTNNGDNIFNAPYYITVFANQYGGNILNTSTVNEPLNADDTTQTQISLSFNELCQYPDLSRIVAALNCDGIGIAQNGGHQNECDTTNNLISLEIDIKPDTISVSQAACEEYEWFDSIYAESGVYYYTKSTEGACDSIFELSLTIFDSPTITISGNTYINAGESVTLTASGADTYVWSTGETGDSISVSPDDNTTYSVVGTDENGCTGTASFTVRLRVNVGIPVYVAMRDTSDCHIDGHVYSFKLEPLTTGAPMPENDVIGIEAPTVNGIAGKRGFGPEDADNPWRMAFEEGTWNYKISQVPNPVPTADTLDNGYWAISILITPDSIQKWEIISAEYNVPIGDMTAASFYIVKEYESGVNETAADVSVDEFGRTRLVLGGDEVRDIDAFNMAVIKSKFEIDFRRNFTAIGSVTPPPAAVPDGTLVGFIAN